MRKLLFLILFLPVMAFGQTLTEYKAINNITYRVGDTVRLGKGSTPEGNFQFFQVGGWNAVLSHGHDMHIDYGYANKLAVIKAIKKGKNMGRGPVRLWFVVGAGNVSNFNLYIDEAIKVCEVVPCQQLGPYSVADELLKLKKLLDAGAITQEEYDTQKKKLLAQ